MNKRRSKNIISKIVAGVLVVFLLLLAFFIFSKGYAYFNTGASKKDILNELEYEISDHTPKFEWNDNGNVGREVEDYLKYKLSQDYANALYFSNLAHDSDLSPNISEFYSPERVLEWEIRFKDQEIKQTQVISRTDLHHHIDFHLYSLDGQMLSFTDTAVICERYRLSKDKVYYRYMKVVSDVVMELRDMNWKIRHRVPRDYFETDYAHHPLKKSPAIKVANKGRFLINGQPFSPIGVNYYPAESPWALWENFNPDTLKNDFKLIKETGWNTVRFFIPYHEFGRGNTYSYELSKLDTLLQLAHEADLKVMPTLFDFIHDYRLAGRSGVDRYLENILTRYKGHPAILAWDIKNEPDLDIPHHGKEEVLSWLDFILARARKYDPDALFTIGWSIPGVADQYYDKVDFVSFHFYEEPEKLIPAIHQLSSKTKNTPLFLTEYGASTQLDWFHPFGSTEGQQYEYYRKTLNVLKTKGNIPSLCWTVHDFKEVPSKVVGSLPWRKNPQKGFGIYFTNGKMKPAGLLFSSDKHESPKKSVLPYFMQKPFFWVMFMCLILTIPFGLVIRWLFPKLKSVIFPNLNTEKP